ncbi:MAG: hypothetical protein K0S60_303 [Evtepia sp.]|nr:hypothetical protein [Evtepia sp.]
MIQGLRLIGKPKVTTEQQHGLTASTLLTCFMESVSKTGNHYTEIQEITQGYLYSAGNSARAKLIPTWRIKTDQGEVLLNCMTGKVETPSSWLTNREVPRD